MLIASSKCIISSDLYKVQHPHNAPRAANLISTKENSISFHCERLVIKIPLTSMHRLLPHFKTTLTCDTQKLWFIIIIFFPSVKHWIRLYGFLMSFSSLNEIERELDRNRFRCPTKVICLLFNVFVKLIFIDTTCLSRRYQFLSRLDVVQLPYDNFIIKSWNAMIYLSDILEIDDAYYHNKISFHEFE